MTASILIVDDDDNLRNIMLIQVKKLGYTGQTASHGIEAMDLFKAEKFDLILMDVQMPHFDGLEACRVIRDLEKNGALKRIPIIAITASPNRDACLAAGMDDFLFKPVLLAEMQEAIARWLPSKN